MKQNTKITLSVCGFAFAANLVLFSVKLYVGLSSNSISIFSDAINNMFDSLSGLVTFICLMCVASSAKTDADPVIRKAEQLFSFIISVITTLAGFYFLYNSLERFLYPAPVWYMTKYLVLICVTAAAKLMMFMFYRLMSKKSASSVIRVLALDSLLDFFITCATVISLVLSQNAGVAVDAIFGLVISCVIIISAVKMVLSGAASLINFVSSERRETVREIICGNPAVSDCVEIKYLTDSDDVYAYARISFQADADSVQIEKAVSQISEECAEKTGIRVNVIR
ncbi:MAG: cation diffusion facilitator family transporter [Acutalibacteraceae bacterium]